MFLAASIAHVQAPCNKINVSCSICFILHLRKVLHRLSISDVSKNKMEHNKIKLAKLVKRHPLALAVIA